MGAPSGGATGSLETTYTAEFDTSMLLAYGEYYFTDPVEIDFSDVTFTNFGVYQYTLTQTESTAAGVVNDSDLVRDIYVFVELIGGEYVISQIIMYNDAFTSDFDQEDYDADKGVDVKSDGFINSYGVDPTDPTDPDDPDEPGKPGDDASEDFYVTFVTKGSLANAGKDFTVTLTAGADIDDGTIFKVTNPDGDYFAILSVVEGMTFTATITDEDADGYTFYDRD